MLFWHLADRFGHVMTEGTVVPLRPTHRDIAEFAGSQRCSVSVLLSELAKRGRLVRRPDRTWLLLGEPPLQLRDMRTHNENRPGTPKIAMRLSNLRGAPRPARHGAERIGSDD